MKKLSRLFVVLLILSCQSGCFTYVAGEALEEKSLSLHEPDVSIQHVIAQSIYVPAVAADVLTSPVQLVAFGVFLYVFRDL